jgi:hypothetical protein
MAHALQEIAELEALVPSIIRTARFYRNAAAPLFHPFYSTITVRTRQACHAGRIDRAASAVWR